LVTFIFMCYGWETQRMEQLQKAVEVGAPYEEIDFYVPKSQSLQKVHQLRQPSSIVSLAEFPHHNT